MSESTMVIRVYSVPNEYVTIFNSGVKQVGGQVKQMTTKDDGNTAIAVKATGTVHSAVSSIEFAYNS